MDSRYFYGVRVEAAKALINCSGEQLDRIGLFHLQKAFKTLFCYEGNAGMTKPNDFADLRLYRIRCAIVQSMAFIRDRDGKAPQEVKQFFLDTLKFNDNSSNQVSMVERHLSYNTDMNSTLTLSTSPTSSPA